MLCCSAKMSDQRANKQDMTYTATNVQNHWLWNIPMHCQMPLDMPMLQHASQSTVDCWKPCLNKLSFKCSCHMSLASFCLDAWFTSRILTILTSHLANINTLTLLSSTVTSDRVRIFHCTALHLHIINMLSILWALFLHYILLVVALACWSASGLEKLTLHMWLASLLPIWSIGSCDR